MPKYMVEIARNETTMYYIEVEAEDEALAEEIACDRYNKGDHDSSKVVYGEEEVWQITEVKDESRHH